MCIRDRVLQNVGSLLMSSVRATDLAARFGGEELTLVLPHTGTAGALQVAEVLRQKIAEQVHAVEGATLQQTVSMGLAAWEGQGPAPSAEGLLKQADDALYRAKQGGRNRVEAAPSV